MLFKKIRNKDGKVAPGVYRYCATNAKKHKMENFKVFVRRHLQTHFLYDKKQYNQTNKLNDKEMKAIEELHWGKYILIDNLNNFSTLIDSQK